jgi:hypothetical protein
VEVVEEAEEKAEGWGEADARGGGRARSRGDAGWMWKIVWQRGPCGCTE